MALRLRVRTSDRTAVSIGPVGAAVSLFILLLVAGRWALIVSAILILGIPVVFLARWLSGFPHHQPVPEVTYFASRSAVAEIPYPIDADYRGLLPEGEGFRPVAGAPMSPARWKHVH